MYIAYLKSRFLKFCKISTMAKLPDNPSPERTRFARRLRAMRVPRGFKTARGFAEQLGIHENRYTRYERAEVEPDLGLLMKICSVLSVTPNDLLCQDTGIVDPATSAQHSGSGFKEDAAGRIGDGPPASTNDPDTYRFQAAAWELACELAQITESRASLGEPEPAGVIETAGRIFQRLEANPFAVLSEIGTTIPISTASLENQKRVAGCIAAVAASLRPADDRRDADKA